MIAIGGGAGVLYLNNLGDQPKAVSSAPNPSQAVPPIPTPLKVPDTTAIAEEEKLKKDEADRIAAAAEERRKFDAD